MGIIQNVERNLTIDLREVVLEICYQTFLELTTHSINCMGLK